MNSAATLVSLPDPADVADGIRDALGVRKPVAAIVLGSGLGGLVQRLERVSSVPYAEIPGFVAPTVAGHAGMLMRGDLDGREVLALAGRFHMYEGHDPAHVAFPVRVVAALGADTLVVSNAAGGVRRTFAPGDLMIIADHINLMWRNPLRGPRQAGRVPEAGKGEMNESQQGDQRFPDMSDPYDPELRALLRQAAATARSPVQEGVYAGLLGPVYETPAEVRMLERLGVDAVGMSTVPEVLVARAIGMRVAGVSCITNQAAGLTPHKIDHAEVIEVTRQAASRFERIIVEFIRRL